jgi:hypothetical protein
MAQAAAIRDYVTMDKIQVQVLLARGDASRSDSESRVKCQHLPPLPVALLVVVDKASIPY